MNRIYLKHAYRGIRTNAKLVAAGEYDAGDPALYGLAAYLVDNGHAVWLEAPEDAPVPPDEPDEVTVIEDAAPPSDAIEVDDVLPDEDVTPEVIEDTSPKTSKRK